MNEQTPERKSQITGVEWLAAAAAIAAGTTSYADVIRHDNPEGAGNWDWPLNVLDVTLAAADQPGFAGLGNPTTSYQAYFSDFYPTFSYATTYQTSGGMGIFSAGFADHYAAPLDAGTPVGSDLLDDGSFTTGTVFEFLFTACDYYYPYDCTDGARGIIPSNVDTYLGVRFDNGGGDQYGWVKIRRSGVTINALAWGYQTEPGVAIPAGATPCAEDVTGNGVVNVDDLVELFINWGTDGPGAEIAAPFDVANVDDLVALIEGWGNCPPPAAATAPPAGSLESLAHGSARSK